MISLFLLVLFSSVLCEMAPGPIKEYISVQSLKTWSTAQNYCRENFQDLAIITTANENTRARNSMLYWVSWIGLKMTNQGSWMWTDGTLPTNFQLFTTEPEDSQEASSCAILSFGKWFDEPCSKNYSPICYRNVTLVKENKTWDEALEYCRQNHNDLYSTASYKPILLSEVDTIHPQTASVWMGLRFLDGSWFWLNGYSVNMVSLPSCPGAQYRCGAQNINTSVWENRGCGEKLNFLCY